MEYFVSTNDFNIFIESQKRNICEEVVDQLYHKRLALGMTQQDVSDITGIKRPNIARIEGCTTTPTVDVLIKYAAALGYKLNISLEEVETQRTGRNKDTLVNTAYINGGEYRRKFDRITQSDELNKLIYQKSKEMLTHRSGTEYEDMYWFDMETNSILCSKLDETNTKEIRHTKSIDKKLSQSKNILAIHTHPHSMPPSPEDFDTYKKAGYSMGIVLCHDGTIYRYQAMEDIPVELMSFHINRSFGKTLNDKQAQLRVLDKFMNMEILFYEETSYEKSTIN